jgi:ribosomal protein S18 acetylase RimI-like enzyme
VTFQIRRLRRDEWRAYRDLRLRALADSPDAFGSTHAVEAAKPDEFWQNRVPIEQLYTQQPLVAEGPAGLLGLVWGWIDPDSSEAQVYQMWVAPEGRNQGIGAALIDGVIAWAKANNVRVVTLRVTCGDTPARRLYVRAGFEPFGEIEPLRPGSSVLTQPMRLRLVI